jgi:hypothetical protein
MAYATTNGTAVKLGGPYAAAAPSADVSRRAGALANDRAATVRRNEQHGRSIEGGSLAARGLLLADAAYPYARL